METCSICSREYDGFGNNARPINTGRCCDDCNTLVIAARFERHRRNLPMQHTAEELETKKD